MKRLPILIFFVLLTIACRAQTLSVESFKALDNDLTANTAGTMKRDQNGNVAALIRVVTSEKGFVFDGGMMGIVSTKQDVGEILVYVPGGIQKITVKHDQLGVLRDYYFPIPIEKGRTYEMRLISGVVRTIVEDQLNAQFVTLSVQPKTASVRIDDNPCQLDSEGNVSQLLSYGNHTYHVEAPGYSSEDGVIQVGSEKKKVSVALQSSMGTVTVQCPMAEAEIYLNNELVGHGTWTGQLAPAMYQVETRLAGHRSRMTSFTLGTRETKTVSVPAPQPLYGSLSITSTPGEATVLLDGKEIGETPLLQGNILVGEHELEFVLKDYKPYKTAVTVKESQMESVNVTLSDVFQAVISSRPAGASLSIDGRASGTTPVKIEMPSGDYDIRIAKPGYVSFHKTMHIDASHPELSFDLQKSLLTKNQLYLNCSYGLIGHKSLNFGAGLFWQNLNVDLGYSVSQEDNFSIYWLTDPSLNAASTVCEEYQYQCKMRLSAALGYGIRLGNIFRLTPQAGIMNTVIASVKGQEQETSVLCGMAALRLEYSPVGHIAVVARPSYLIPVKMGPIAEQLDTCTPLVKDWCSGFSAEFGVELYF